ncbi:hypothetical protein DEO72_LG9g1839 [Vigna unguiculata]|uniref:Uncharacterized protein n=1 Tax=Vigna unguiculata TaxID=3917 RepID=A0A4D6N401_VIGUN|nr:hypothetical protein DEO72_LG9g1839 [Vigna unguiculata]
MSSSSLSDRSATKIHLDRVGASLAFPSTSSSTTSSNEDGVVGSPSSGYEWVHKGVHEYFSKYQSSSSIRKFAAAYAILDEDSPDEAVSLDQVGHSLPRRLPTKCIVAILNSPRPSRDMLALMASHEGVGAGQKSRFQLLREKVNARKKDEDALVGSSSGAAGRNSAGRGTPRPPPATKKKRKKTSQKGESSSRHSSPKRSRVSEVVVYTRLMGTEMQIYDGMSIIISQQEADIIAHSPLPTLMKAFAEYQSRALVIGRHIDHELDKSSHVEELETKVLSLKVEKENLMYEVSNLRS